MATITKRRIEPIRTVSGNSPRTLHLPEGASQTFKAGECVELRDGYVKICASSTNPTAILGFAAEDAHNGATNGLYNTKVWLADSDTIFVGNVSDSHTTAVTDRGRLAGLKDETNTWGVDKDESAANSRVIIVDLDDRDAVGDTNGRVHFVVRQDWFQLGTTS